KALVGLMGISGLGVPGVGRFAVAVSDFVKSEHQAAMVRIEKLLARGIGIRFAAVGDEAGSGGIEQVMEHLVRLVAIGFTRIIISAIHVAQDRLTTARELGVIVLGICPVKSLKVIRYARFEGKSPAG